MKHNNVGIKDGIKKSNRRMNIIQRIKTFFNYVFNLNVISTPDCALGKSENSSHSDERQNLQYDQIKKERSDLGNIVNEPCDGISSQMFWEEYRRTFLRTTQRFHENVRFQLQNRYGSSSCDNQAHQQNTP